MSLPPFQTLLDTHGRDVHRFLIATAGRQAADDCYQETWLAALRAYPRLQETSNLRGWLLTIAHRKAIDHFRRTARVAVPMAEVPDRLPPGPPSEPAGFEPDVELWAQVRALPPKQRSAVGLRFVLDASYAEIATAMDTSEEAARRSVYEGLTKLRGERRADG